jgi:Cytidylate kinase
MRESEVHRFLEGEASLIERWRISRKRLSRHTAEEIFELAAKGSVIIRGWGAAYLLRNVPHVICVRICAPMEVREDVLMQRIGIQDRALARREIERSDAVHNANARKLFGIDRTDASLYAIVLNTARVPVEDCVEHIVRLAGSPAFQETPERRQALQDQVIAARVRSALHRRFGQGGSAPGIEVTVSAGKVTLSGAATDEHLIVDAIRLAHTVEGVGWRRE